MTRTSLHSSIRLEELSQLSLAFLGHPPLHTLSELPFIWPRWSIIISYDYFSVPFIFRFHPNIFCSPANVFIMWHSFSLQTQYPSWPILAQFPLACCVCPCINFPYPNYSACFWFGPLLSNPGCIMCLLYLSVFVFFQSLLSMHMKTICKESCLEFALRVFLALVSFRVLPPSVELIRPISSPSPQTPSMVPSSQMYSLLPQHLCALLCDFAEETGILYLLCRIPQSFV